MRSRGPFNQGDVARGRVIGPGAAGIRLGLTAASVCGGARRGPRIRWKPRSTRKAHEESVVFALLIVGVVVAVPVLCAADRIIKAQARARRLRTMSERLTAATARADKQHERQQEVTEASAELTSLMPASTVRSPCRTIQDRTRPDRMSRYRTRRGWTKRNRTSTRPVPAGQAACLAAPRSPLADVLTGPGASSRAGRE